MNSSVTYPRAATSVRGRQNAMPRRPPVPGPVMVGVFPMGGECCRARRAASSPPRDRAAYHPGMAPDTTSRRTVAIVPHTHWDREWYSPFQTFRLRLVDLLDDFLPALEDDLSYARFLLDGQMAVVDDYLEVRPEAEPTLRRLAATGRLAMGPWYTLPDEFLVSGETHIRNLQLGLEKATAFGGAMDV